MSATMAARARTGASLSAPARRPQQPARRRSSPWIARMLRAAAQRPGRALIFLAFGLASAAIIANALMFQRARHPHPMVTYAPTVEPARPAAPARRADAAPTAAVEAPMAPAQPAAAVPGLPPMRPSDLSQAPAQREAAPRPPATVSAAARVPAPAPVAAAQRPAPARDPIADLINGGDIRPPADVGARASAPRRTTN